MVIGPRTPRLAVVAGLIIRSSALINLCLHRETRTILGGQSGSRHVRSRRSPSAHVLARIAPRVRTCLRSAALCAASAPHSPMILQQNFSWRGAYLGRVRAARHRSDLLRAERCRRSRTIRSIYRLGPPKAHPKRTLQLNSGTSRSIARILGHIFLGQGLRKGRTRRPQSSSRRSAVFGIWAHCPRSGISFAVASRV